MGAQTRYHNEIKHGAGDGMRLYSPSNANWRVAIYPADLIWDEPAYVRVRLSTATTANPASTTEFIGLYLIYKNGGLHIDPEWGYTDRGGFDADLTNMTFLKYPAWPMPDSTGGASFFDIILPARFKLEA
jgi:hypothetical protein